MNRCADQRGIALVIVLWLIALLSLLALGQTAAVRTETRVTANQLESASARAAAYGCIQLALLEMMRPPAARTWDVDGTVHSATLEEARLSVRITDESGKVDINFASGPLLDTLLQAADVEEAARWSLVDAILDWRDPDNLRRAHGAEAADYQTAGLDYTPRNAPFRRIEELTLVRGMTAALYHTLAGSITVHSGNAHLNGELATSPLLQRMLQGEWMTEGYSDALDTPPPALAVARGGGRVYSLRCAAHLPSGVREEAEVLVRLTPARGNAAPLHEILLWRAGAAVSTLLDR